MSIKHTSPILHWPAALILTGLTLYLMLSPTVKIPYDLFGDLTDKVAHFVLFGILAASWYWLLTDYVPRRRAVLIALVATIVFGACTELAQSFVPGRDSNFFDFLSNALGVSATAAIVSWRGTV